MGEGPEKRAPSKEPKRSLNDFAYLFLTRPGEDRRMDGEKAKDPPPEETPAAAISSRPSPDPSAPDPPHPPPPPGPIPRSAAFLGSGEGWLRTFLAAETALYLSREGFSVQVAQEGGLFPTVSGHLGRILGRPNGGGASILVTQAGPGLRREGNKDFFLFEVPAHLPRWAAETCRRVDLLVLAVPANPAGRIRAFHQLKRVLRILPPSLQVAVAPAERPGSGEGREIFHRFLAAQGELPRERFTFLGALPLEPALEKVFLAERKPALVWSPASQAAAALGRIGAGILRALQPREAAR